MYFVYILKSLKKEIYYKGSTNNINRRLEEHLNGISKTTRLMLPIKLIQVEICETREEAVKLEMFYKSGAGRDVIKQFLAPSSNG